MRVGQYNRFVCVDSAAASAGTVPPPPEGLSSPSHSSSSTKSSGFKMDVNDFIRAAELDPVLIKVPFSLYVVAQRLN